jgi:hypothetical protein
MKSLRCSQPTDSEISFCDFPLIQKSDAVLPSQKPEFFYH